MKEWLGDELVMTECFGDRLMISSTGDGR
jgi:hypothetical protein